MSKLPSLLELMHQASGRKPKPLPQMRPTLLRGVDLFAGAGGFTIGAMQAGCHIGVAVEKNRDAARTARKAGHTVACDDIATFAYDEVLFHVDLLIGGPPCQPFSSMGAGKGRYDPRDGFPLALDAIDRLQPRRVVFENVVGFLSPRHRAYREHVLADLARRFKHVGTWRLNAKDFGVPQDRERVFIWGAERPVAPPEPTHGPMAGRPYVSVREAIPGFPTPAIHVHSVSAKSRSIDEPSPTVATKGTIYTAGKAGIVYPYDWRKDKARRLRVEELKAIQAFPGTFTFTGTLTSQYTQVGNAVPPPLGKAVVFAMMAGIDSRALTPKETLDALQRENPEALLFEPREEYDAALVGVTNTSPYAPGELVAVYGYEKLLDILLGILERDHPDEDPEERFSWAMDHLHQNMMGSLGPHFPLVLRIEDPVDWSADAQEQDDEAPSARPQVRVQAVERPHRGPASVRPAGGHPKDVEAAIAQNVAKHGRLTPGALRPGDVVEDVHGNRRTVARTVADGVYAWWPTDTFADKPVKMRRLEMWRLVERAPTTTKTASRGSRAGVRSRRRTA